MEHWWDEFPRSALARLIEPKRVFRLIGLCDCERIGEVFDMGANPNCRNTKGRPVLHHAIRGLVIEHPVVTLLLARGADPNALDRFGMTALDHAHRRLLKYEGRPRKKPRRSPSLTAGGELNLKPYEWHFIDKMEAAHPGFADDYLKDRRRVAERVFDTRGNLEKIVEILEPVTRE